MAIPSGSGTEVLKRAYLDNASTTEQSIFDGVANHIYTIISIVILERNNASGNTFDLAVDYNASGNRQLILIAQPVAKQETFVFNDKIVLTGTDKLRFLCSGGNFDVWCSYIDQDWT